MPCELNHSFALTQNGQLDFEYTTTSI